MDLAQVNAIIRAVRVLKYLAEEKGKTLSEISEFLNLPKSSTHDILSTLKNEGLIKYENKGMKSYSLGIGIYELGTAYFSQLNLTSLVKPYLEQLMNTFHTTVFLAVEDNGEIVYIDKSEPLTFFRTTLGLGTRNGMDHKGLGKALLAFYSSNKLKRILGSQTLTPKTRQTITGYEALLAELRLIKERGYAIDDREDNENVICVAAPIMNNNSEPIAAISVSFFSNEVNDTKLTVIGEKVKKVALDISSKLGYVAGKI